MVHSPLVSVIIVNFNGKNFLRDCLNSLFNQKYKHIEVIVVDNGSSDGSLSFIEKNFPSVKIISSSINSFSYANNLGINKSNGEYVFVLNNDTEVEQNCLGVLMSDALVSPPEVGMWATKIMNFYDRKIIDNTGLSIYKDGMSRGRGRLDKDEGQFDGENEACFPSGCAGLYKKSMLDEIGLFDEDFHFFVEDTDLGFRARLAGWKCRFIPRAVVFHRYSSTVGKFSSRKAFLVERNRIWLAIKVFPLHLLLLNPWYSAKRFYFQLHGALLGQGASGRYVRENSFMKLIGIVLLAWLNALLKLPKILKKRHTILSKKKISNKDILTLFKTFGISSRELSLKE